MADVLNETVIPVLDEGGPAAAAADPSVPVLDESRAVADTPDLPKQATVNDDGSVTLSLLFPVELKYRSGQTGDIRTESYATLRFQRMTGADLNAITATAKDRMMQVAAGRSLRLSLAKFGMLWDAMDARDTFNTILVAGYFLGGGRKTGE